MRNVLVTLNGGQGSDLGPNFSLTCDGGGVVTPNTATLSQLLTGKSVVVDDNATEIYVTATDGPCVGSPPLVLPISGIPTATPTASPTASPTSGPTTSPTPTPSYPVLQDTTGDVNLTYLEDAFTAEMLDSHRIGVGIAEADFRTLFNIPSDRTIINILSVQSSVAPGSNVIVGSYEEADTTLKEYSAINSAVEFSNVGLLPGNIVDFDVHDITAPPPEWFTQAFDHLVATTGYGPLLFGISITYTYTAPPTPTPTPTL